MLPKDVLEMKMFKTALKMEEKGRAFYEKASKEAKDPFGRKIFEMLRDDEEIHINRINLLYKSLKEQNEFSSEWKRFKTSYKALGKIFKELAKRHKKEELKANSTDIPALDIGIELELESISFYKKELEEAKSSKEKAFIEQMVKEEEEHLRTLSEMKLYFTDPSSWYSEKEKAGLDGA